MGNRWTPRERVLATFRFEPADRVPYDLMEASVWPELMDYFREERGLADANDVYDFLDVDCRWTAMDYVGPVTGIIAGDDDKQWNHTSCDLALKAGCSTIEVHDTEVWVSDVVTFYAPEGDDLPAYRWVCDIVKLQNCIYNTELIFNSTDWRGHPIVADDQPTTNPNARKPFMAKADIAEMLVGLGKAAILADVATAKKTILASVNGANSRRLDTEVTYAIASNVGIVSHTQKFGFYFGA